MSAGASAAQSTSSLAKAKPSKRGSGTASAGPIVAGWRDTSASLAVSEDESDRKSRRSERNLREQERSHRITERITELRTLLSEAGVHFKPDRYSTLVSVVDYIQELQARSANLDMEHKKLLNTIAVADQLANNSHYPVSPGGGGQEGEDGGNNINNTNNMGMTATLQTHRPLENAGAASSNSSSSSSPLCHSNSDEEVMVFIQGIDYKNIFASCGVALAITSVDGRFVDCNEEFLKVTDYTRSELLGDEPRQWNGIMPSSHSHHHHRGGGQGQVVTVSTSVSTNSSTALLTSAAVAGSATTMNPDFQRSSQLNNKGDLPPPEIITRKQHLSLFNLLSGEDMETVYSVMSQMLRSPEHSVASITSSSRDSSYNTTSEKQTSSSDPTDESSSSDSFIKSNKTSSTDISTPEEMSRGNDISNEESIGGVGGEGSSSSGGDGSGASRYTTVDHWTGRVKHTRRKNQSVSRDSEFYGSNACFQGPI
jgi:PAS domain-containing protein